MQTQVKPIQKSRTSMIAFCGILAGISAVLMMVLEFPIPFMPPFLKFDFSNIPVIIGSLLYGPLAGVGIAFVKSVLHLFKSTTGGVGEIADFIVCISLCLPITFLYRKSSKGGIKILVFGAVLSCLAAGIVGMIANKFLLIQFFSKLMPLETILETCGKINPLIGSVNTYLLFGALPFNFIKGAMLFVLSLLFFKRLEPHLKRVM